jgi:Protein of unknown function (DUF3307)
MLLTSGGAGWPEVRLFPALAGRGHGGMVMQPAIMTILMLVWLQLKHYVADYLMQPKWVLFAKGDMRRAGGYVHAGIHAVGSIPAYLIAGLGLTDMAVLCLAEFIIHYVVDFIKVDLSARSKSGPDSTIYWALHGGDQLLHQLTYAGLIFAALSMSGG